MSDILSVNRRTYPAADHRDPEEATVTVVLVAGDIGDYAAYQGFGPPEWVARFGDKLGFEEAAVHFPVGLEREKYRL